MEALFTAASTDIATAATSLGTYLVAALAIPLAFLGFGVVKKGINRSR